MHFNSDAGLVKAVNGVDFYIETGETLALLGETGSGKTVLGMALMKLLPVNTIFAGNLIYQGRDILQCTESEMRAIRGREIATIMQNPLSSLNPAFTISTQIADVLSRRRGYEHRTAINEAGKTLEKTGISAVFGRFYPHQFSGGMRQRSMIALGIACIPQLLIADEPTKGLDVTVQIQIVDLLKSLLDDSNRSMLLITHDLGVAAEMADRVAIMYAGKIIEMGSVREIFNNPLHPYTKGLIAAHPCNGLKPIEGNSPSLVNLPSGCVFNPRCKKADDRCKCEEPETVAINEFHEVRCHHAES